MDTDELTQMVQLAQSMYLLFLEIQSLMNDTDDPLFKQLLCTDLKKSLYKLQGVLQRLIVYHQNLQ